MIYLVFHNPWFQTLRIYKMEWNAAARHKLLWFPHKLQLAHELQLPYKLSQLQLLLKLRVWLQLQLTAQFT